MIGGIGHSAFRQTLRQDIAAKARESLSAALNESELFHPPAQALWLMFIRQRLRRETAMSMQMFSSVVDVRLPYMDNELIATVMRMSPELKMGDRIQSYILGQCMPSFLDVVNANTGARIGASARVQRLSSLRLRVFSKLRVPGYQPYERLGLWLSKDLQPFVRRLLLSDQFLDRGLFERQAIRQIIDDHAARTRNHTFQLMAMLIFELGQRQLLGEAAPSA
jgi:hypothetical protein